MDDSRRLPKPTITNHLLRGTMRSAARGSTEALVALQVLVNFHGAGLQRKSEAKIAELRAALAWAEQEAWTRQCLKAFYPDVQKCMERALEGDTNALSHLEVLAEGTQASAAEAKVALRFVKAKLEASGG